MGIEDSAGAEDLYSWLWNRTVDAERFLVRTPELSTAGVRALEGELQRLRDQGVRVEIVLTTAGGGIDAVAARALMELFADSETGSVRVNLDQRLAEQPAVYVLDQAEQAEVWMGPTPVTTEGLARGRRHALVLTSSDDGDAAISAVRERLERDYAQATPVEQDVLEQLANSGKGRAAEADRGVFLQDAVLPAMNALDALAGGRGLQLTTGFDDFDAVTGGLFPGTVTVLTGLPGSGVSTLALDIARRAAVAEKHPTALVQLDSGRDELLQRVMSAEARVRIGDMRHGRMTGDDWTRLVRRMTEVEAAPLMVQTGPGVRWAGLREQIRTWRAVHGLRLVVGDSLTLLAAGVTAGLEEVLRDLRELALDLAVAVVVTCPAGGTVPLRPAHAPQQGLAVPEPVAYLADTIVHLYRPDRDDRHDRRMGEADLVLLKHRGGPTATVTVAHQLHYSRFVTMATD